MNNLTPNFMDIPNVVPELVPMLIEAGDPDLASEYIELNARTREVYESSMRNLEENSVPNFDELHQDMKRQMNLLKDSLILQLMLTEKHPNLALWMVTETTKQQLDALEKDNPFLSGLFSDEED